MHRYRIQQTILFSLIPKISSLVSGTLGTMQATGSHTSLGMRLILNCYCSFTIAHKGSMNKIETHSIEVEASDPICSDKCDSFVVINLPLPSVH